MRRMMWLGVLGAAGLSAGAATGQQAPPGAPTENRGVRTDAVSSLDLAGQIDGVAGRQLRVRRIVVEPGGQVAVHQHRERPGTVYVVEGAVVEHRDGGEPREYRAG